MKGITYKTKTLHDFKIIWNQNEYLKENFITYWIDTLLIYLLSEWMNEWMHMVEVCVEIIHANCLLVV